MDVSALPQTIAQLFDLLEERQIVYVLVGGVALLQYVEGRNTQDIDLIIALEDLQRLPEIDVKEQNVYFARGDYQGLSIDFLLTTNALFQEVQTHYGVRHDFAGRDIRCVTVEGLILLKLYALPLLYRQGEFARVGLYENDIATLLHYYHPDLPALLNQLHAHLNETDWNEVQDIAGDIERRLTRFQQMKPADET